MRVSLWLLMCCQWVYEPVLGLICTCLQKLLFGGVDQPSLGWGALKPTPRGVCHPREHPKQSCLGGVMPHKALLLLQKGNTGNGSRDRTGHLVGIELSFVGQILDMLPTQESD